MFNKWIFAAIMIVCIAFVFPLGLFAEEQTTDDVSVYVSLIMNANRFAHMLVYNEDLTSGQLYRQFIEEGIVVGDVRVTPAESMQTLSAWRVYAETYFTPNAFNPELHLNETNDGLMFGKQGRKSSNFPTPIYAGMQVLSQDEETVALTFPAFVDGIVESGHTVELRKVQGAWRIDGGSYFDSVYAGKEYKVPSECTEFEELMVLFNHGTLYTGMFHKLIGYYNTRQQPHTKGVQWLYDAEYLSENMELISVSDIPHYTAVINYHKRMTSISEWEKETKKYFVNAWKNILPAYEPYATVFERNGQTYGYGGDEKNYSPWYESVRLCSLTDQTAEIEVSLLYAGGYIRETTVEFLKTENGWRISGGTYFESIYGAYADPPKTGDSTAAYALIFTLAALPLAGFGVYEWKKRRRAV